MNFKKKSRVVLAGLQLANVKDFEHKSSMDELERLVTTLGFETLERFSQKRKLPHSGYLFGKGKLKEIAGEDRKISGILSQLVEKEHKAWSKKVDKFQ